MTSAAGRLHRRRLRGRARRRIRRVEVRRLGGELGGARVDHRVAGASAPIASRAPRTAVGRDAGQPGQLAVAEARPLGRREERHRRRRRPARRCARRPAATSASSATLRPISATNHERDAGRLLDVVLRDAAPEQGEDPPQPRVRRGEEAAQDDRGGAPLGQPGRLAGLPVGVDPGDRRGEARRRRPRVVGVDRPGPPPGSRSSAARPGPRPAARHPPARARGGPCSARPRRSGRWPSPRRSPSSGCPGCGRRSGTCRTGSAAA